MIDALSLPEQLPHHALCLALTILEDAYAAADCELWHAQLLAERLPTWGCGVDNWVFHCYLICCCLWSSVSR